MKKLVIIALWFLLPACAFKKSAISEVSLKNKNIPLFIEMPRNIQVFDNIAPIVYQALQRHCMRVGYTVVDRSSDGYTLQVHIRSLEPISKLVSPDVILVHSYVRLELECTLLNFNQQIVAHKRFFFSSLISKPRNPIINSDFLNFEYRRLCQRSAPKVEYFFRPFLLNAFADDAA